MLAILAKIFKALNSDQSPGQLAAAISFACIMGMTPLLSLHNLLVLLLVLWLRVNLTLFIVSYPLFALLGYILAGPMNAIGEAILTMPGLQGTFEALYNTAMGRWSEFYYAGVMGSLTVSLVLAIVLYPLSAKFVGLYRDKWLEKFEKLKIIQMLKASKFWTLYQDLA